MNYRSVNFKNLNSFLKLLMIFTIIISILTTTPLAAASDLDEFEKAATTEKTKEESDDAKDEEDEDGKLLINLSEDDEDDSFLGFVVGEFFKAIFGTFFSMIGDGTRMSLARIEGDVETVAANVEFRRTGEATLPFFQYDHRYLRVNSDIDARDNGLEIGYGPYAFSCRHTKFSEDDPEDELTLIQYHLLVRISRTGFAEYGVGLGSLVMQGNDDNSGFSLTFPIKIYPNDSFGARFRPTFSWIKGNSIDEYDLSLVYTIRYASIQLGYRFLEANGKELNGSYLGFAVHY